MATDVVMPKLSDTMEDGKILRWLKKKGDRVSAGEAIAEVETDKADMELEAEADGVLSEIVAGEGSSVAVGDVIARLSDSAAGDGAEGGNGARAEERRPTEPTEAAEEPGEAETTAETEAAGGEREEPDRGEEAETAGAEPEERPGRKTRAARPPKTESPQEAPTRPRGPAHGGRPRVKRASPEAERVARERGIDLSTVRGSGPGGRIVLRDLERAGEETKAPAARGPAPERPRAAGREELSRLRRTVARRMTESKREAPHFYMTVEIGMEDCARMKDALESARPDIPVSYTHLLVRAVAIALEEHPRIQARYVPEDAVEFSEGIHVGLAVATDQGLIVPVLHDCQDKDVFEIAQESRSLVERVRAGKAEGKDLSGGTFTISNLGMFPIEEFSAVINPPQSAVLAVGSTKERPVVRDGRVVAEKTMRVTLSSDHRVIDGAEAARFLETLKAVVESPARLLL